MKLRDDYRHDHGDHFSLQDFLDWLLANNAPLWIKESCSEERIDPGAIGKGTHRKIDVNANTGKVLRIYEETIII
jgi:hypothetical protein